MDNAAWMARALSKIEGYGPNTSFEIKQLFDSVEWTTLPANDRRAFGRYFSNEYKDGRIPGIEKLPIGKDRRTHYRKF